MVILNSQSKYAMAVSETSDSKVENDFNCRQYFLFQHHLTKRRYNQKS